MAMHMFLRLSSVEADREMELSPDIPHTALKTWILETTYNQFVS